MSTEYEEAIRKRLSYDPETGTIIRKRTGKSANSYRNGYRIITVAVSNKCRCFNEHRVAWFLMTGRWPKQVDHKNRVRDDNRWENLREATPRQNSSNRVHPSASGLPRGVYYRRDGKRKKRYSAKIRVAGVAYHYGPFFTPKEASDAYELAFDKHFGAEWRPDGQEQREDPNVNRQTTH
jgi:hypothetical protein